MIGRKNTLLATANESVPNQIEFHCIVAPFVILPAILWCNATYCITQALTAVIAIVERLLMLPVFGEYVQSTGTSDSFQALSLCSKSPIAPSILEQDKMRQDMKQALDLRPHYPKTQDTLLHQKPKTH